MDIDKNVPMPKTHQSEKYPFAKMEVGDSFFSENKAAQSSAHVFARRRKGMKFVTRAEGQGIRIWRVA